jgi:DNA-binding transcriptional regulator YiaG
MTLTLGQRVHWFQLIADLRRLGLTTPAIAAKLGVPRSTIQDWAEGGHPRHAPGERLIALWCVSMKRPRSSTPLIEEADFRA